MQFIFGKDRANGHGAEGAVDAIEIFKKKMNLTMRLTRYESEIPLNSPPSISTPRAHSSAS
ncbi:hypothetical protein SESBI_50293 [Sesbania bispinosa]|nr:hypothetical protein SESBI_50293 [Sesbania bispinosa]